MNMVNWNHTWFKSKGRVVYDPPRPGLRKKPDKWCVINIDPEITRYYRWWVDREILNPLGFEKGGLCQPSWGAHISIIRGLNDLRHCPFDWAPLWKKYDGEIVEFEYSNIVRQSGDTTPGFRPENYWFIEVRCPLATQIRKELQLKTNWRLHITIGRTWKDRQPVIKK